MSLLDGIWIITYLIWVDSAPSSKQQEARSEASGFVMLCCVMFTLYIYPFNFSTIYSNSNSTSSYVFALPYR